MTVPRYLPPCLPVPLANPGQSNPLARYLTKWHPSPSAKTPPTSPSESSLSINQDFNPAPFAAKLNNPRSLRTPLRKSSLTPVIRLFPYCRFYFSFFFYLICSTFCAIKVSSRSIYREIEGVTNKPPKRHLANTSLKKPRNTSQFIEKQRICSAKWLALEFNRGKRQRINQLLASNIGLQHSEIRTCRQICVILPP